MEVGSFQFQHFSDTRAQSVGQSDSHIEPRRWIFENMVPPVAPHFSRQHRCLTQLHFPAPSLLLSLFRHVYGLDGCSVVLLLTLSQAMGSRLSSSEPKNEIQPRKGCFGSMKQLFKPCFSWFLQVFFWEGAYRAKGVVPTRGQGTRNPHMQQEERWLPIIFSCIPLTQDNPNKWLSNNEKLNIQVNFTTS